MTEIEKAYIAGLFDGEGTICISRAKRKTNKCGYEWRLLIKIAITDRRVLEYICDKSGIGRVNIFKQSGALNGRYRPTWIWIVHSRNAIEFLYLIKDYLVIKQAQAKLGIEFQARKSKRTRNPEWQSGYAGRMRELNSRWGW